MLEGELFGLFNKKIDSIVDIISKSGGGKLELKPTSAQLYFKCLIYNYDGEDVIIPIGTRSLPDGISKEKSDIVIFSNNKEKIVILTSRLKDLIRKEANKDNLFFDSKVNNCMCIKLNINKLV